MDTNFPNILTDPFTPEGIKSVPDGQRVKKVVVMAKIPYKVFTDKQSNFSGTQLLQIERTGKNTNISLPGQQKENKYELVSCGDYNTYAIVNI